MANPEHVEIVRRGAAAIAEWRARHPDESLDLSGAHLRQAHLSGADLSGANLSEADLRNADLRRVTLMEVDLTGANLSGAHLTEAALIEADLRGANLSDTSLFGAVLYADDLRGANLGAADLTWASLVSNLLGGVQLSGATCNFTIIGHCDLSEVRGLDTVQHERPSSIGTDTLAETLEGAGGQFTSQQRTFFENAGVPKPLLDYLPDLLEAEPIQFFSCFISHGTQDGAFAQRLYDDLRKRGIRCWKYDEDAIIGRGVWANISRAIVLHEKMVVICSESSLQRPGVQGEIERALQKEEQLLKEKAERGNADMDTDVLVPVMLDRYVLEGWEHPRKADVIKKHVGDFREWQDEAKYKKAFSRLLRSLDPRSKLGLSRLI